MCVCVDSQSGLRNSSKYNKKKQQQGCQTRGSGATYNLIRYRLNDYNCLKNIIDKRRERKLYPEEVKYTVLRSSEYYLTVRIHRNGSKYTTPYSSDLSIINSDVRFSR